MPMLLKNWKLIAGVLIVLGLVFAGWKANGWRIAAQNLKIAEKQIETMQEVAQENRELSVALAEERAKDKTIIEYKDREVIRYVESGGTNCDVPNLHIMRNEANRELSRTSE